MAHADYHCCAVCDMKLEFSYDAEAKEVICQDCLKNLRNNGVPIRTTRELIDWINTERGNAIKILDSIGFSECRFYYSDVDMAYREVKED